MRQSHSRLPQGVRNRSTWLRRKPLAQSEIDADLRTQDHCVPDIVRATRNVRFRPKADLRLRRHGARLALVSERFDYERECGGRLPVRIVEVVSRKFRTPILKNADQPSTIDVLAHLVVGQIGQSEAR